MSEVDYVAARKAARKAHHRKHVAAKHRFRALKAAALAAACFLGFGVGAVSSSVLANAYNVTTAIVSNVPDDGSHLTVIVHKSCRNNRGTKPTCLSTSATVTNDGAIGASYSDSYGTQALPADGTTIVVSLHPVTAVFGCTVGSFTFDDDPLGHGFCA